MKKNLYTFFHLVVMVLFTSGISLQAQVLVSDWGSTPRGTNGWTIFNTASTPDGDASMGGSARPTGWMSIRGGFAPITATTSEAFVITGKMEFVGGGGASAYTWLRYALFNEENDTLSNQYADSAKWKETRANGYIFTPVSGSGTVPNTFNTWPQGNQGTEWPLINSVAWTSTNSNGGGPFSTVYNAPFLAEASEGTYDWAISVQPQAGGGNEVRWYLVKEHAANEQTTYWWAGSFTDTSSLSTFNSIGFAFNSDFEATGVNFSEVTVGLGEPITVPEEPFEGFYVNRWGSTPRGSAWPVLNDSNYVDGNASMGNGAQPTGWASIRGGFRQEVTATLEKAFVITGKMEFVGGGGASAYTWLRYALFNEENDTLSNQYADSAKWKETRANGYIFTPVSGSGTVPNTFNTWPQGNQGTEWPLINSVAWTSTNSNGGGPFSTVYNAPFLAEASEGTYDWAISVQPQAGGGNEVRWYLVKEHAANEQTTYWWAGSFTDTSSLSTFNSIGFAFNSDFEATQINLIDVYVDLGDPIVIPFKPFEDFYVNRWGFIGDRINNWTLTPGDLDGNVSIGGDALTDWSAIRGAFPGTVDLVPDTSLVITGKMELVGGGFEAANSLLLGLVYSDSAGTLDTLDEIGRAHV
jgi:hypothetical protein